MANAHRIARGESQYVPEQRASGDHRRERLAVGSTLVRAFGAAGWRVIALQRSAAREGEFLPYSLADGPARPLPAELSAVVHCAYDLKVRDAGEIERVNTGGTERLLAAARATCPTLRC